MEKYIQKVRGSEDLSQNEAYNAMISILDSASDSEIYDFLIAMNEKEISVDELTGFTKGMKDRAKIINPKVKNLVDTCGTGGDGSGTINISTGAAIIISAAGVNVAKHGNYSVSSKSGSANVLEVLGYNLNQSPEDSKKMIEEHNFGFLFAPNFHPAMKRVAQVRKKIGKRTLFNLLGPLCNPANANAQLIGVYDENLCEKYCNVLKNLGIKRALVVYGSGLDEISNVNDTKICELNRNVVISYEIKPEDFGFKRYHLKEISGSSPEENAKYLQAIFNGEKGARRDILVLNAGAGIYLGEGAKSLKEGIQKAEEALDTGAVSKKLSEIIEYSYK